MLSNGPTPITLQLPPPSAAQTLRIGQTLETTLQGAAQRPLLNLGGMRIPLEPNPALLPGQIVHVEVLQTTPQLQLKLLPLGGTTAAAPPAPAPLDALLAPILRALGALDESAVAPRFLPRQLPHDPQALRQLLALFFERGQLADDIRQLSLLLQKAAGDSILAAGDLQVFNQYAAQFAAQSSDDFQQLLKQTLGGQHLEARLLRALQTGQLSTALDALRATLRAQVAQLRGNQALLAYLRGTRQLRQFEGTAQRILDRLAGGELQNLRSLEQPYHFLELPLGQDGPLRHAQIHFFAEGRQSNKSAIDPKNATIILDLDTSRLGPLWITLRLQSGQCQCQFRAVSEAVRQALDAARPELAHALAQGGYPNPRIQTTPWDGNRLQAAAALMDRFGGLNLNI